MNVSDRIILALDLSDETEALAWAKRFGGRVGLFKIGLRLFTAAGPSLVARVAEHGPVFLDLKLHDIPNTVGAAVREASKLGATMLTVHASGGLAMLRAASEAASEGARGSRGSDLDREPQAVIDPAGPDRLRGLQNAQRAQSATVARLRILAVTVLTSLDTGDLAALGIARSPSAQVQSLAEIAWFAGCDGLVASPHEIAPLRARLGAAPLLVTPGIRAAGSAADDQKRTSTLAEALASGADYLVIGRPILEAADPEAALESIVQSASV